MIRCVEPSTLTPIETSNAPAERATAPETRSEGTSEGAEQGRDRDSPETDGERDETGRYLSREAASYRRRLRETETERDGLRARVDNLQRAEVERLASAAGLAVASDVWQFGATLDTLRGESGEVDAETVKGLVGEIVRDRPGLRQPHGDVGIGRGGAANGNRPPKIGLSALFGKDA